MVQLDLAVGYGRKAALKEEMQVGINAYALYKNFNNVQSITLAKANGVHEFACVQGQKTLMGRGDIIKETTLTVFNSEDAEHWNEKPMVSLDHQEVEATTVDLWESFDRSTGHHFNLSIDLNACTGCGACVIACHAENNVPVVGKAEVRRSRDMHWLRIDRYYSSESTFEGDNKRKEGIAGLSSSLSTFNEMEKAGENPQVAFQPVMCQHCNHAPCETVCPVAATSHGREGQNHMAYNRCVGTRYCANNCPYKVRRFNWFLYNKNSEFDYHMNDDLGRMVLNPDVNVRSRGVMEKCSMCIQMTQATKLKAKNEGRPVRDGEFQTACSSACSSGAMIFGDVNDADSKVVGHLVGLVQHQQRRLASQPSSLSTAFTARICSSAVGLLASTTCSSSRACRASSSVALNDATRWCGRSRMKPTVSVSSTWPQSLIGHLRVRVSSVENSLFSASTPAPVSAFISVLLPALV